MKQNVCVRAEVVLKALLETQCFLFAPPVRKYDTLPLIEMSSLRSIKQSLPSRTDSFKQLGDVTTPLTFYLAVEQLCVSGKDTVHSYTPE